MTILRFIKKSILCLLVFGVIVIRTAMPTEQQIQPTVLPQNEYHLYYTYLNDKEKKLYDDIYHHVLNMETEFVPTISIKTEEVSDAFEAVFNDHPELFWMDTTYSYRYNNAGECVHIILSFNETAANIDKAKQMFETNADVILQEASKLQNDFEKELYIHNKLLLDTVYDETATMHQSAYSVLVNKKSVCAGYARAFQYLMNQLEIPTYYCMSLTEGHAWNIVQLDDGYYNVDVTWDDEATSSYMYFNCSDEALHETHVRTGKSLLLPKCNGKKYAIGKLY